MCDVDLFCYSFNYFVFVMICEFNNLLWCVDLGNFLCRFGFVYLDKLKEFVDYCVLFLCRNNGICKIVRCYFGFECFCYDEFIGVKCESKK